LVWEIKDSKKAFFAEGGNSCNSIMRKQKAPLGESRKKKRGREPLN